MLPLYILDYHVNLRRTKSFWSIEDHLYTTIEQIGYLRPPTPRHTAPIIFLLWNRIFRDEGYKLFYHQNVFAFVDLLRLLGRSYMSPTDSAQLRSSQSCQFRP
jgi:hypothetical protein